MMPGDFFWGEQMTHCSYRSNNNCLLEDLPLAWAASSFSHVSDFTSLPYFPLQKFLVCMEAGTVNTYSTQHSLNCSFKKDVYCRKVAYKLCTYLRDSLGSLLWFMVVVTESPDSLSG